jgi:hypothetical protein
MSHFAQVINGIVTQVIVAEQADIATLSDPENWVQTSYNTRDGVHYGPDGNPDGGVALRGNYAGIGHTYDSANDVFYPPAPYPSWVISAPNWIWAAPVPMPETGGPYKWDEPSKSWVVTSLTNPVA